MAKKELFWLGIGVININGTDYGAEMPIPTKEINDADLKKMIADGRVGEKIAPVTDVAAAAVVTLQEKVAGLDVELAKAVQEIAELQTQVESDGSKIVELEADLAKDSAKKDLKEANKTIKERDEQIVKLEADLEEATKPAETEKE